MIFTKPNITEAEVTAVANAVRANNLATGSIVAEFEAAFTTRFGYPHVVAVNSGTTALTLALYALGVGHGDEVIVTPYSISSTVNCILCVGAIPVFCDIDRETYNLDPACISGRLTSRTKAILPASIFGVPCDIEGIRLAAPGLPILEDSIEALGATRDGQAVGLDADIATFGFFPNKQITTGYGGVAVTSDPRLATTIRAMRQMGHPGRPDLWSPAFGWNARLADPLAALGKVQLDRLDEMQQALTLAQQTLDLYFRRYL